MFWGEGLFVFPDPAALHRDRVPRIQGKVQFRAGALLKPRSRYANGAAADVDVGFQKWRVRPTSINGRIRNSAIPTGVSVRPSHLRRLHTENEVRLPRGRAMSDSVTRKVAIHAVPNIPESDVSGDPREVISRIPASPPPARTAEYPSVADEAPDNDKEPGNDRKGILRRRPVVSSVGLVLLRLSGALGYLYYDYGNHFETTDDAFIAARQFAIAPKVSGYITAVPVTDNQHVAAGDVIARIDDRDYRVALEQAEAQVAAAQANIRTSMRRSTCSRRRSAPARPRWSRRRQRWCLRSSRRRATRIWRKRATARFRTPSSTLRSCVSSRPALDSAQASLKVGAAADRGAEGATQQRRREPRAGKGPARPGAAQPVLHDRDGGPARTCRSISPRRRAVRASRART